MLRQRRCVLYRGVLRDARFFELLLKIDKEYRERVRRGRCPHCGGPLHAAHFCRKPRGLVLGPAQLPEGYEVRFDLCCGWCRKRVLPRSVRFLGRKVFVGVAVAVATVVVRGRNRDAVALLRRELGISWHTLRRWCRWWQTLTGTAFWQRVRGALPADLDLDELPKSLLDHFHGDASKRLERLLRLLSPLSRGFPGTLTKGA